jgi:hypothetical protein
MAPVGRTNHAPLYKFAKSAFSPVKNAMNGLEQKNEHV